MCDPQRLHFFDEKGLFTRGIQQGCQFDVDVFLAPGSVVQVQDTFTLAGFAGQHQGTGLTCAVTWHAEMVRHLIAGTPNHTAFRTELASVGRVGCQDAVLGIKEDVGFRHAFQKRHEFGQGFHGVHSPCCVCHNSLCHVADKLPYLAVTVIPWFASVFFESV